MDERATTTIDGSRITQVLIWFLFLAAVLGAGARLATKWAMSRKLFLDDVLIIAAQVAYLAQAISASFAASHGLGKPLSSLTDDELDGLLKAEYASVPFFILTLALVKWSISDFITQLTPSDHHLHVDMGLRVLVGAWLVCGVVAGLFQCSIPAPWDYVHGSRCINRLAWGAFVSVVNIVTELGYVFLFVWIIGTLQMPLWRRVTILLVFLLRLLVVGAAIAQLVAYWNIQDDSDVSLSLYLPTVLNQVVLCVSVVTACLPHLKPLMVSLESGIVRVPDDPEELVYMRGVSSVQQSGSQLKSSRSGASQKQEQPGA